MLTSSVLTRKSAPVVRLVFARARIGRVRSRWVSLLKNLSSCLTLAPRTCSWTSPHTTPSCPSLPRMCTSPLISPMKLSMCMAMFTSTTCPSVVSRPSKSPSAMAVRTLMVRIPVAPLAFRSPRLKTGCMVSSRILLCGPPRSSTSFNLARTSLLSVRTAKPRSTSARSTSLSWAVLSPGLTRTRTRRSGGRRSSLMDTRWKMLF